MKNPRRTKIIATLGPSTDSPQMLRKVLQYGANVVRLNLSHGSLESQIARLQQVKQLSEELGLVVGILVDLQGPKIRIRTFKEKNVTLQEGHPFTLDTMRTEPGDEHEVGIDYEHLIKDVQAGDELLLDDGRISLEVVSVRDSKVHTKVLVGGDLSNNKGLNRKGGGLSAPSLTSRDRELLQAMSKYPIDYVALSFVKSAEDILEARQWLDMCELDAGLIAKIERQEAVDNAQAIIDASDAIMVARGDLGVELGYAVLPSIQKDLILKAQNSDKIVITATQMMESMIDNTLPTRAEVSDVANAILDGTDAVMLSAETAAGKHPDKVIKAIDDICLHAEQSPVATQSHHRVHSQFTRHDEAIAMAAMYVANHLPIKAIVALTESGSTPVWMSRIRSSIPIYGLSRHLKSCGRMTLYRGVYPVLFDPTDYQSWEITRFAVGTLVQRHLLSPGDKVIVTKGNIIGVGGKANSLKIVTAEATL